MEILKISFVLIICILASAKSASVNGDNNLIPGLKDPNLPKSESELSNLIKTRSGDGVTQLDRFYRVYEDGTIEFKFVLSNGVAQYQKITNKEVNGKIIQVYEGYHSELLPDNTYRTTYYIADENGFRRIRREFDTKPPVLPPYVPYVPKLKNL
ncbi:uncharacterized protein LOC129912535 [Episyrphus balteatus]|uniref:uncharacterized protein LOC129912535 n=1 Tax=Episyrphus balteatus TaxID=286459 RepID=UPI002484EE7D|nr:uncharacterized protein LOC129912535 [Episyrphus balteatus]XP_055846799.1 uncharacterized protein LOC129912535 [Episyrphus balteatus]XP_055846800.1 uncharacterized protein LOC129912535 [Episyrphus balteatus]